MSEMAAEMAQQIQPLHAWKAKPCDVSLAVNRANCRFAGSYSWEHVIQEPFAVRADVGFQ